MLMTKDCVVSFLFVPSFNLFIENNNIDYTVYTYMSSILQRAGFEARTWSKEFKSWWNSLLSSLQEVVVSNVLPKEQ